MKVKRLNVSHSVQSEKERNPLQDIDYNASQTAWVIDDALNDDFLRVVDQFRQSLPLDAKRPTVKRRFFSSAKLCPEIRVGLVDAVKAGISTSSLKVHILAYMRFLEYDAAGGRLDPHTDGNKRCEDTNLQSTHTLWLYWRDCSTGRETVLFDKSKDPPTMIEAVKPVSGRILLFPHPTLHEGASTVDVPKLCLRAEVSLSAAG